MHNFSLRLHESLLLRLYCSQSVAQPSAKRRFAVAAGTACGLVPTELKVHICIMLNAKYKMLNVMFGCYAFCISRDVP